MELKLSENIRNLRKQRKLTQEQLAEILDVTTGSVHKWETGSSIPELRLILEMAVFFDCSVDALLGYAVKDNSFCAIRQRLSELCRKGDPVALSEAEDTLKKYPNAFEIVFACASVYRTFGMDQYRGDLLGRALELFEYSLRLIAQNSDPSINESTVYGQIGGIYLSMGETEKGVEIMEKHNAGGMFDGDIGLTLSVVLGQSEKARPYLSRALRDSVFSLMNTVVGYAFVYSDTGDYVALRDIVTLGQDLMNSLRASEGTSILDKTNAGLLTLLSHAELQSENTALAYELLKKAAALVRQFDTAPDFGIGSVRFATGVETWNVHDMLGGTARESVTFILERLRNPKLTSLWEETMINCEPK